MARPPKSFDDILPAGGGGAPAVSDAPASSAPEPPIPEPAEPSVALPPHKRRRPVAGDAGGPAARPSAPGPGSGVAPGSGVGIGEVRQSGSGIQQRQTRHHVGPFPWLGPWQIAIPVFFAALIGISVWVLTAVGHAPLGTAPPPTAKPIPIIFVFNSSQGTITNTSGPHYTITMNGVAPTTLSYGGSSLSMIQASVASTADVVLNWKSNQFAANPPNGALVPSTPSSAASSVAVSIDQVTYDSATQVMTVRGTLVSGSSSVSNIPAGFANANFYVDTDNGLPIDGCVIQPGVNCAGSGGATYINQDFAYAQLAGSNFSAANLSESNLENSNFSGAKMGNAVITGANLTNANFSFANLTNANLNNANLTDATLYSAGAQSALLRGANLSGTNLSAANLAGADLSNADMSAVLVHSTNFTNANLTGANLTNANLSDSDFTDANLTDTNLTDANLNGSGMLNANMTGAFFCNTTMPDGVVQNPGC